MQLLRLAFLVMEFIDHARRGGDQIEIIFARQAFLDDFKVQQAKEAAAEALTQRGAGFHLKREAGVIEAEFADGFAEFFKVRRIDREEPAKDDRLDFFVAFERLWGGGFYGGDRVADGGVRDLFDLRGDEADFAGAEFGQLDALGIETADAVHKMLCAGGHEFDVEAFF